MTKMNEVDMYVQEVIMTMKTFDVDQGIALDAVVTHYDLTSGEKRDIIYFLHQRSKENGT